MGRAWCLPFCSLLSASPRSAAAARDTSPSLWDTKPCSGVTSAAVLGAGTLLPSSPAEPTGCCCKPGASLPSTHARVGTANSVLNEGFGINAPNLGPSLLLNALDLSLSLFHCDLGRLSSSYLYFEPLNLHWQPRKCCLKVLNFIWGGLLQPCLKLP